MTYLGLLGLGVLLPAVALRAAAGRGPSRPLTAAGTALALVALVWTLPWDAALLRAGTWRYPHGQVLPWAAGVPLEEWLFVLLQAALVTAWVHLRPAARGRGSRAAGAGGWGVAAVAGLLLVPHPRTSYLGALLLWAAPVLALQQAVGGDRLGLRRVAGVVAVPTLWLCLLDRAALGLQLWALSPARTTGVRLLGLPVEEALFFLLTDLLLVQGLLLATDPVVLARLRLPQSTTAPADLASSTAVATSMCTPAQSTSARSAPDRSAPLRSAPVSRAPRSRARDRSADDRSHVRRSASDRSASASRTPASATPRRSAPRSPA